MHFINEKALDSLRRFWFDVDMIMIVIIVVCCCAMTERLFVYTEYRYYLCMLHTGTDEINISNTFDEY